MAFDQAIADRICERIAEGISTRKACEELQQNRSELYKWLGENPSFADQFARAKNESAESLADELIDIAEDGRNDWEERENAKTGETYIALNREAIERSRLRIDARKWVASKLLPKKYGDRLQTDNETRVTVVLRDMRKESDGS